MKKSKILGLSTFVCMLSSHVWAASTLMFHCRALPVKHDQLMLNSLHKATVFIISNKTANKVLLSYENNGQGASAGWDNQLQPFKSSALLLTKKQSLSFRCIESTETSQQVLPCQQLLTACYATRADLSISESGSFWVVENATKKELPFALSHKGIEVE